MTSNIKALKLLRSRASARRALLFLTVYTVKNYGLKVINEADVHDREYQALYTGSPVLDALVRLTGMPLDRMHYLPKELRKYTKKHYG